MKTLNETGLAFDVYVHRLRQEIGAMVATMGGIDVLIFTGGVGEHSPEVRAAACAPFGFAGVALAPAANAAVDGDVDGEAEISAVDSRARTYVVTAREDIEVARQVRATAPDS